MSSVVPSQPYVAPWQTQFNRYSTQLVTLKGTGSTTRDLVVPELQWWRPIYLMVQYQTDSNAGARVMELRVVPGSGGNPYVQPANIDQGENAFATYIWGVGVSNAAQTNVALFEVSVQSIPDLLWPPGTDFFLIMNGASPTDAWHTDPGMAIEIYTEDYNTGALVPAAPATPLLV